MTNSSNISGVGDISFDNLYPAILQCFVIILGGYIAGRSNLITKTQGKGIGTFVSNFCLPALLFKSMCELNFSEVNWVFLWSILIAKTFVFVAVFIITLVVKRPMNLGSAGLFSIFSTQSNDFALGYPILQALYQDNHPEYLQYIYLVAPISLVFLNPIGFVFMEIHKKQTTTDTNIKKCAMVGHVIKGVVTNPIVFMTVIGIVGNFIFKQHIPNILRDFLVVLGDAFSATALFYLGLSLVGKVKNQNRFEFFTPVLLIAAKSLLLPLITWEVTSWLTSQENCSNSESLSMYGFLYGTFPTAPSVFLYASQYGVAQDTIATGMVAGTFLSAPLMFVSAKMMTVVVRSERDYISLLMDTFFDTSIVSMICCVWVLGVLILSGRWKRVPHRFTTCYVLSQLVACIGMTMYTKHSSMATWQEYIQIILLLVGVFGTRCWTAMIAIALYLAHSRSLCFVLRVQVWLLFFGFGVPVMSVGLLFLFGHNHIVHQIDPSFHLGQIQSAFSVFILVISIVITIVSLILRQRNDRLKPKHDQTSSVNSSLRFQQKKRLDNNSTGSSRTYKPGNLADMEQSIASASCCSGGSDHKNYQACDKSLGYQERSIEDIIPFPKNSNMDDNSSTVSESSASSEGLLNPYIDERTCLIGQCNTDQRRLCTGRIRTYLQQTTVQSDEPQVEEAKPSHEVLQEEFQSGRHLVLLLLLLLSMFIGLFLCMWRVFNSHPTGIYIEIEFLDGFFNYGQGFLAFAVFGFDTRLMFSPIVRRIRRLLYGVEVIHLPNKSELEEEIQQTCDQFVEYHKENCAREILQDLRYRLRKYQEVFTGTALCDWLVKVGLASDRGEAIEYGRRLVLGQVIRHVTGEHHFHDLPYFYKFINEYISC